MDKRPGKKAVCDHCLSGVEGERGVALVIALMVMVVLAMLGAAAIMTSTIEVEIAGNEKLYQTAFYAADAGVRLAPRVVRDVLTQYESPAYNGSVVKVADGLLEELLHFQTENDDPSTDSTFTNPDIWIPSLTGPSWAVGESRLPNRTSGYSVGVDVDREAATRSLPGGGIEFGAGYEGIGAGGAAGGGAAIVFIVTSEARGPKNTSSGVQTQYLYVIGVGGGS